MPKTRKNELPPQESLENQGFPALNEPQHKAATATPERPLLIVAGAGTGKTRTLTSRVAHFLRTGVPGDQICAITFTNKAANEMKERIARFLPATSNRGGVPFIGTFHALGARILRRYAPAVGRTASFVIFDDHDSFSLVKKILKELERPKEKPSGMYGKVSAIKNGAIALEEELPFVRTVFARYEHALESQNAFDFDDLLQKVVWLFKKHPEILRTYQEKFTHILIDEYQDLNNMQYELVKLLAAPSMRRGQGASLSVVGDAEQTIYGWRGSNIEIFLRFPDDWQGAEMVTLTENYRSTKTILRAASGVIAMNEYDTKVTRATDLWTANGEGERVVLYEAYDEDTEAMWIGEQIARLTDPKLRIFRMPQNGNGHSEHSDAFGTSDHGESTAILYRTNAQSRAIEQALLKRRIPYRVYGGLKFYERREIKDVVAALRYSLNPRDEMARERLEKAFTKRVFKTLHEAFENEPQDASPLARIDTFMKTVDYLGFIESHLTNPRERRENIEELIHFAGAYKDTAELVSEIALLQTTDVVGNAKRQGRDVKDSTIVSLMTIHLAKGLEFDTVFVAGVTEGLLPHGRAEGKAGLQEERRLMYVAMTRARKRLFLSFYELPSRFIGEIPEDTIDFQSELGSERKGSLDWNDEEYEERYITLD